MSLVQQFLQQNLYKNLDHHLLEKLQQQQVAIEDLLYQVSSMRTKPKDQALNTKIERVQNFLKLQKNVICILNNQSGFSGLQWIYQTIGENPVLQALIKKDQENIKKQIRKVFKKIFIQGQNNPNEHFQSDLICNNYSLSLKQLLKMKQNKQMPQRPHLIKIDLLQKKFEDIVAKFQRKIKNFNFEMLKIIEKLYQFQENIAKLFQAVFQQEPKQDSPIYTQQYEQQKENQSPQQYNYDPSPNLNFTPLNYHDDFFQKSTSLINMNNHHFHSNFMNNQNVFHQKPIRMKSQINKY